LDNAVRGGTNGVEQLVTLDGIDVEVRRATAMQHVPTGRSSS